MSLLRPSEGFPQRADPVPSCVGTRLSLSLRSVAVSNVFSAITIARKRVFGLSSPSLFSLATSELRGDHLIGQVGRF